MDQPLDTRTPTTTFQGVSPPMNQLRRAQWISPPRPAVVAAVARVSRAVTRIDVSKPVLPSSNEIYSTISGSQIYRRALSTMATMIRQSVLSGACAVLTNLWFTRGFFWTGKSPASQSHTQFLAATMGNVSFCLAVAMLLGHTVIFAKHKSTKHRPHERASYLFWLLRLVRGSLFHYILSLVCVVTVSCLCAPLGPALQPYQLHFYLSGVVINYYTTALDVASKRLYQTETVEGVARGYVNRAPKWRRILVTYPKTFVYVAVVFVAAGYIHVASRMEISSQQSLLLFSFGSMGVRSATMKLARYFILRLPKAHVRVLYIVAIVPTVMINTQVRVALLRVQANVSMTGVVILAAMEPAMRLYKVWSVRREVLRSGPSTAEGRAALISSATDTPYIITRRKARRASASAATVHVAPQRLQVGQDSLSSSGSQQANPQATGLAGTTAGQSDAAAAATVRSRRPDRQQWVERLLQFTAAEIHADMCSEYIAIACSMSIFYCLDGHPKFEWNLQKEGTTDTSSSSSSSSKRVQLVLIQLVTELAIDFSCCVWELANGIPLRINSSINRFLNMVFIGCAVTNIAMCCAFYLKPPAS